MIIELPKQDKGATEFIKMVEVIKQRVLFSLTGKCPECGVGAWFIMDANEWYHCSNCDWSEKDGPIENRLKIEDISVGEGLIHQS